MSATRLTAWGIEGDPIVFDARDRPEGADRIQAILAFAEEQSRLFPGKIAKAYQMSVANDMESFVIDIDDGYGCGYWACIGDHNSNFYTSICEYGNTCGGGIGGGSQLASGDGRGCDWCYSYRDGNGRGYGEGQSNGDGRGDGYCHGSSHSFDDLPRVARRGGRHRSRARKEPMMTTKEIAILVLQRGWVAVGEVSQAGTTVSLERAAVIRRWGTTTGLGEIAMGGPTAKTVLDPIGSASVHELGVVLKIACAPEKWADHLHG